MLEQLPKSDSGEYCCCVNLNLYDSSHCEHLATQAAAERHVRILLTTAVDNAIQVCLCEDDYLAWLPIQDIVQLKPAATSYQAIALSRWEIENHISKVIAFTKSAMEQPNYYLWGGTVGPNYDCSGLIQAAFAAQGIWLPRDSYQQQAFTQAIAIEELLPGDLIFFGTQKVNHVALYLGKKYYIHSSGVQIGRNGIGIDQLSEHTQGVSQAYYRQLWSAGRVMQSYQPQKIDRYISS